MRELTKDSDTEAVALFCLEHDLPAEVVGVWIWVRFAEKPDKETRTLLKTSGFRWSPRRQEWAHNCGNPTRASKNARHPRHFYGSVEVEAIADQLLPV